MFENLNQLYIKTEVAATRKRCFRQQKFDTIKLMKKGGICCLKEAR